MATPRSHPNFLAGPYLERLALLRKDAQRVRAALEDPSTLFVPVWQARSFIADAQHALTAQLIAGARQFGQLDPAEFILLGEFRGRLSFAVEVSSEQSLQPAHPDTRAEFRDLRSIAGELPRDEAALLAYARAMVLWRERHRFCGRCGSPTLATEGGHVRVCSDPACGTQQFPRIDPAIIVLVTHAEHGLGERGPGERALLGRQAAWLPGRYSTIAGFVEPGESLEDAVVREVREETGVRVDAVEYHSSQPWPFPSSLMVGFFAQAATTGIELTDAELEDARWVTRAQIAAGEVSLPTTHSISFRLIEDWYDAGSATPLREEPRARLWTAPR
jgi:NAD+ diphosphatase